MNKIECLVALDFFKCISRDECDGGADIGNGEFCIEKCQDVQTVFNGRIGAFLVVIERFFYLEVGVGYFGCDGHMLSGLALLQDVIMLNTITCLFYINKLSRMASRGDARGLMG